MKKTLLAIVIGLGFLNLCSQDVMTPELLWKLGRVGSPIVSQDGNTIYFTVRYYDLDSNKGQSQIYSIPFSGGEMQKLTDLDGAIGGLKNLPSGSLGYESRGQLWSLNPDLSSEQVSDFEKPMSGIKYHPDGSSLIGTIKVNFKNLSDAYLKYPKANVKIYDQLMFRHWDRWTDGSRNHVGLVNVEDSKVKSNVTDILAGESFDVPMKPFGGSDDYVWNPAKKQIIYQCKKLNGVEYARSTNSELYRHDLESGEIAKVARTRKGYDSHPTFNSTGSKLAWLSMARDGYESDKNDIIILDEKSQLATNITEGWDNTVSSFIWSEDDKKIFFLATINATYQIFEISLPKDLSTINPDKHFRQITTGQYNYRSIIQSGKHLISLRQDMNNASEIFKVNIKSGAAEQLTKVNQGLYASIQRGKIEKRIIKTSDGKDMLTWVIYPPNFDPNKKYPTILYCQGGPQSAVSQFYSFRWNFQLMAAQGYIVVAPNRRGLPGFGVEWNEAISKDWGGQAMRDYFSAIDEMAKEPYVDEKRLGAIGASYGGYSVYMLAGIHQDRFKTFISHCGLFNLESWYNSTEELFFANWDIGGPYYQKNPPMSYEKYSPHKYAANWNTPILVFHGGRDYRVPDGQGLEAFNVAQQKGLKSRLVYFPEEGHWVLSPQNGIVWHTEFFNWLKETL